MNISRDKIKSILLITLSNLGDIVLTTPVLERLHKEFPEASVDIVTGEPGREIFAAHPAVREVTVHKKKKLFIERIRQVMDLRKCKYDIVIDLKNSLIPYVVGAKFHSKISVKTFSNKKVVHKKDEHLSKLASIGITGQSDHYFFIPVTEDEKNYINEIVNGALQKIVIINPGAKSHLKRWEAGKYAELADRMVLERGCSIFITGNDDDNEVVRDVVSRMKEHATDLCGKTSVGALFELMKHANLVITNDSAPLHIASAADVATIAIFGPSDERKYGPLSGRNAVVRPEVDCRPCEKALCAISPDEGCIVRISVDEVYRIAADMLGNIKI